MATAAEREAAAGETLANAIKRLTGEATSPECRFHEIFDHAFGFIGLIARDGTVLEANRTSLEVTRLSRDAVIGLPIWDAPCWPADARERLRAAVAVAANGELVRYETELATGSEMVALDLSLKPISDATGDVVLIIPEARDVTARKHSEAALRESEERFRRIVSITADAIISIDETQRITLFNQGAEQIFGYRAQEVMGQPLDMLLPQELTAAHRRDLREFGASPTIARHIGDRRQISGRRKGGEVFPAEASISKMVVAGKLVFTAVLRDISDRWAQEEERGRLLAATQAARDEAEAAREEAERAGGRISYLAEVSDALSASLDPNETMRALTHLLVPRLAVFCIIDVVDTDGRTYRVDVFHARAEMQRVCDVLRRYPRDRGRPFLSRQVLLTGRSELQALISDDNLAALAQDAEHLEALRALAPRSYICVPLLARGKTLGALTLVRDSGEKPYTERELSLIEEVARRAALAVDNARLYHQAQEAALQRDHMLGVVSHDLGNPLSAIGMCATALKGSAAGAFPERAHLADTIHDSVEWMQRLMADLLDIAGIEAGRLSFDPEPVDPVVIVAKALGLFERIAADKSICFEISGPEHVPAVYADEQRVLQVLSNLLGNAVKFTEPGGRITMEVAESSEGVIFSVTDTGAGIPAEEVPHVFDRFWHSRRGGGTRGTGLGLAIAKGIIEAHGGRIWVETAKGEGSVFRFTVPFVRIAPTLIDTMPYRREGAGDAS
jgi:PAS domain S-box-containing protein